MLTVLMTVAAAPAGAPAGGKGGPMGGMGFFIGLMIMMFVFMFVLQRGSRKKEEAKRQSLLDSIKRNDRVMTHGGILGTVVNIKEREIVLKVDESTNTKMTFLKDAIRQVVDESEESSTS
jgi:preprotein translocase subunit YajC